LPVVKDDEFPTSDQIALSETPVFIRLGSSAVFSRITSAGKKFDLEQNYPNPFNSTTTIRFSLLQPEQETVRVLDMISREVVRLIDNDLEAGNYAVRFLPKGQSSGIYSYKIAAGKFVQTKKALFIR